MQWDDLRIFLAVLRAGNQAAAGRQLGVDASTVGRRVGALQGAIGARLFERTPQGLRATEAGSDLAARAERVEAEILAAEEALRDADKRQTGKVRVTASDGVVNHLLLPRVSELHRAHPELALELQVDNRTLDLSRREADVAVRLFRPRQPNLVVRRLGTIRFGLYAASSYLEAQKPPQRRSDMITHDFIACELGVETPEQTWLRKELPLGSPRLRVNTTLALAAACAEGHGVALLPHFVARDDPRIAPVLPRLSIPGRDVWAVTHQEVRHKVRVLLVSEWLAKVCKDLV